MATNKNILNCPPLRFPDFSDPWKPCIIKDFGKVITGGTPPTSDTLNYNPPKYLWASPGDLGDTKYLYTTKTRISEKGLSKVKPLPKGSILITCIGLIGKMGIATEKIASNQQINAVIVYDAFSNEYVYYAIYSKANRFQSMASTQVLPILSKSEFEKLPNSYPSLAEQKMIAEFLSLIDERIETQRQTIEERKKQKKALLHQIFSQTLRFPDFSDPWQQTMLGKVCTIKTGKLDANAMVEDGPYPFFTCAKQTYQTDTYSFSGEAILIAGNGEVGLTKYYDGKFNAYQRTYVLQSFSSDIILLFIRNHVDYALPKRIISLLNGSAMPYITLSTLSDMPISLPSLEEQKKIAELLVIFDERIEMEEALLKCYEAQKRYLLRQMFV